MKSILKKIILINVQKLEKIQLLWNDSQFPNNYAKDQFEYKRTIFGINEIMWKLYTHTLSKVNNSNGKYGNQM